MTSSRPDYASANKNYFNDPTLTYDDPRIIKLAKRSVLHQFVLVLFMCIYLDQHRPYENIILSMKIQQQSWILHVVQVRALKLTYLTLHFRV